MGMNSDQVLDHLDAIAKTPGRNDKEAMVAEGAKDSLFRAVLVAAYDPFVRYGVTGFAPAGDVTNAFTTLPGFLNHLATRRLTGGAAADALASWAVTHSKKTQELMRRILTKDLRAGFTAGTCNRAVPGMIPVFEVMLAHKFEAKRIKKWPVAVEPKLDGVRVACIAHVRKTVDGLTTKGEVEFLSRNGKPFSAVDHLKEPMLDFLAAAGICEDVFLDGEMVAGSFNKTVGDVRRKSVAAADVAFHIFDGMELRAFHIFDGGLAMEKERRGWLEDLFSQQRDSGSFKLGEQELVNSVDEIMELYASYRARGLEGVIVKPLDALYVKKRSHAWLKVKGEETHDLIVTGAFEGSGKYEGMLGGLKVDFNGVEVRVGGGFSDEQRRSLWERIMREEVGTIDVIGSMIEVEAHEVTIDGSLRHPRFVRFRPDKQPIAKAA